MSTEASPCSRPPEDPQDASCQHTAFRAVNAHGIIWRANLNRAASFCATTASICLCGDGRLIAFCDGSCVLTLDTPAAADAESSFPHRGSLASPVGLLRVADCPVAPTRIANRFADSHQGEGRSNGTNVVQNVVRPMLTTTHAVPQHRRFHCICWLPPFSFFDFTHPAIGGPSGLSQRCAAGLWDGGCRCLAVTTREGGVSLWIQKEKETPLAQPLTLACDLGLVWRQHASQQALDVDTPEPPYVFFWYFPSPASDGELGRLPNEFSSHRMPLSSSGDVVFDEPLVAAPISSVCVPFPQEQLPYTYSSSEQKAASRTPSGSSSTCLCEGGLFSGTLVAVASNGFIAIFLVSGSRLRHRASSGRARSTSGNSSRWRQATPLPAKSTPSVSQCSHPKRVKAPESPLAAALIEEEETETLEPSSRPCRAAARRARTAVTAALSAEVLSEPEQAKEPSAHAATRARRGRKGGAAGRGRRPQGETPVTEENDSITASATNQKTKTQPPRASRDARERELSGKKSPPPRRQLQGPTSKGRERADAFGLSPSSPSFVASEASSSSSSTSSLTASNSASEDAGGLSEDETDGSTEKGKRRQGKQQVNVKRSRTAKDAAADSNSGTTVLISAAAKKQQENWRRAADAAVEAADAERAFAAEGLLQPLLLMVLAIPRPSRSDSGISNNAASWAVPPPPREGLITDLAVGAPRIQTAAERAATGIPPGGETSRSSSLETTNTDSYMAALSEQNTLCCSFQVVAALSGGAVWSFDCSFHLCGGQLQKQQQQALGTCGNRKGMLLCGTEFVVEEVTAAVPQLLLPFAGIPSGFLQLSDVKDALLPMPETAKKASALETTVSPSAAGKSLSLQGKMLKQLAGGLSSSWQVVAVICGSRLRVAVMRGSGSSAAWCSKAGSAVSQQFEAARLEASIFALGFQRGLEGPIVSLCILPVVPLDLAAAAMRQTPALQSGERPFMVLLVALHRGALLPFVLYPCNNTETSRSSSGSDCQVGMPSWVLQPMAPVTSLNRAGRIEDLLMPRAIHAFRPITSTSPVSDRAWVKAAATTAVAASHSDAFSTEDVSFTMAANNRSDQPSSHEVSAAEALQRQQRQQQNCGFPDGGCGEDGDPSSSLCPPSVKARRARNLLSRRLMALMPSPCGSSLFIVIQQDEVYVQLSIAPLDVSPASVALLSLDSQLLHLLEAGGAAMHCQTGGLSEESRVEGGSRAALAFNAAAARCCAEAQELWALRLALRGPLQRLVIPRSDGKPANLRERGDSGKSSARRGIREKEASEWPSEDDVSMASDCGGDGTVAAAEIPASAAARPSHTSMPAAGALSSFDLLSRTAQAVPLGELFRQHPEEAAADGDPENNIFGPATLRKVLKKACGFALEGQPGVPVQYDIGALWSALLESLEADCLLRFSSAASAASPPEPPAAPAPASLVACSSDGVEWEWASAPPCTHNQLGCRWIAAAVRQRRRVMLHLALRLCGLLAAGRDVSLRSEVALLLMQHLHALSACLRPADPSATPGGYIKKASTCLQRLLLLLLPTSSSDEREGRLFISNGNTACTQAATKTGSGIFPDCRAVIVQDVELQNLLLDTAELWGPYGVAAEAAVKLGEARLAHCPLCRGIGCKSTKPFHCYVCPTYGHRFPACAQCLRCLYTGSEGAAGAPLPLPVGSTGAAAGESEGVPSESSRGVQSVSFFNCVLCDAFVCGGELPEAGAMRGCGWSPHDFAVSRSGRCCPLCRGTLRLASVVRDRHH